MPKLLWIPVLFFILACNKDPESTEGGEILIDSLYINNVYVTNNGNIENIDYSSVEIRVKFHSRVDTLQFSKDKLFITGGVDTNYLHRFGDDRQTLIITLLDPLEGLSTYRVLFDQGPTLGGTIYKSYSFVFVTRLDETPKFPAITEDSLLTLVQRKTFDYFWEYGHPVSGLARERYDSGDIVTTGGSGFGLMAILTGIERGFITRQEGLDRLKTIVSFLIDPATDRFHGAYPHWLNGTTGKVHPFSSKDDGGDLVETAFLVQGLLTVKAYFINGSTAEKALCDSITKIWEGVEWDWYRNGDQNRLYWHWSPNYAWQMNMPVTGWNEALIVYVLAASSPTHTITKEVYDAGWTRNGAFVNNKTFYDILLPLGYDYGGPLFFAHYSFLALDPRNLSDPYTGYWTQLTAHSRINYEYCKANPKQYTGYGSDCWGLTASDIPGGYTASSPTNDQGVIAPTAAVSSLPYTPAESMDALKFFYYILGDRLWGDYGFYDAFSLEEPWFASSYLAIDQGPIVCMIENYRTGLLWDLFMTDEDILAGLTKLGFTY
ncbi:MAG: beta-glucosidase [Bacteroidales bacterium]|nr:beta-glucosidase [Bacteroidales bacterium]